MYLFGHVKQQGALDDTVNFETFVNSMLLLFRLSTGAGWNDILESLSISPPQCNLNFKGIPGGNCGRMSTAVIYLVSYIFVMFLIIVNIYIAIILENFNTVQEEDDFIISKEVFNHYYRLWASHVKDGKQYLPYQKLSSFVADLSEPLQIPQPNKVELVNMKIPLSKDNRVHIFDLLKLLVKRVLEREGEESPEVFDEVVKRIELRFRRKFALRKRVETFETTQDIHNTIHILRPAHLANKAGNRFLKFRNRQKRGTVHEEIPTVSSFQKPVKEDSVRSDASSVSPDTNSETNINTLNDKIANSSANHKLFCNTNGKSCTIMSNNKDAQLGSVRDSKPKAEPQLLETSCVQHHHLECTSNQLNAKPESDKLSSLHEQPSSVTRNVLLKNDCENKDSYKVLNAASSKQSKGISLNSSSQTNVGKNQLNVDEVFERAFARRKKPTTKTDASHEDSSKSNEKESSTDKTDVQVVTLHGMESKGKF